MNKYEEKSTLLMAKLFEGFGINPIVGRLFGLLLSSNSPVSLIEMKDKLNLSKAAVSIHIRLLVGLGYCEKLPKTSDRQNYYRLCSGYLESVYRNRIEREKAFLNDIEKLLEETADENPEVTRQMLDFHDFSSYLIENQIAALDRRKTKNSD